MERKLTKKYHFSVEGETEKWYLDWLKDNINQCDRSRYKVVMDCKVEKDPYKRAKKMVVTSKTEIWHLSDYESNDRFHVQQFHHTIDHLKKASRIKNITYKFGYSNFTFDLWMILHKMDCNKMMMDRKQYITMINKAYNKKFKSMDDYKHKDHFHSCLQQLNIEDVKNAIKRSKNIMSSNKEKGYIIQNYRGYQFYKENPSLMIWEVIEKIFQDCHL